MALPENENDHSVLELISLSSVHMWLGMPSFSSCSSARLCCISKWDFAGLISRSFLLFDPRSNDDFSVGYMSLFSRERNHRKITHYHWESLRIGDSAWTGLIGEYFVG
jgi:hypothetical protein